MRALLSLPPPSCLCYDLPPPRYPYPSDVETTKIYIFVTKIVIKIGHSFFFLIWNVLICAYWPPPYSYQYNKIITRKMLNSVFSFSPGGVPDTVPQLLLRLGATSQQRASFTLHLRYRRRLEPATTEQVPDVMLRSGCSSAIQRGHCEHRPERTQQDGVAPTGLQLLRLRET